MNRDGHIELVIGFFLLIAFFAFLITNVPT
jgi:hypothetical protein